LLLNEDLVEALALMHDIGHPPFGHAGEDVLNECLVDEGGFSHNQFALTLVTEIEIRYTRRPGLNLTREVLQGQGARIDKQAAGPRPLLEVQLVDAADSTTYDAHDVDDALKLGLVTLDEMRNLSLIDQILTTIADEQNQLSSNQLRKAVVYRLIDHQVTDMISHCQQQLDRASFRSAEEALAGSFLIAPSPELANRKEELESFLYERVYRHPELMAVRQQAQKRLKKMVAKLIEHPTLMPLRFQNRIERVGVARAVVEFVAGMTDHYCDSFYALHFQ